MSRVSAFLRRIAVPNPPYGRPGFRWSTVVLVLLCAVLTGGCATGSGGDNPFTAGGGGDSGSIRVAVENRNFNDATLYALSSGQRYRLGRVTGNSNASLELPWSAQEDLRIEIDLLAAGEYRTNAVVVSPGDRLRLVIQPNLRNSYLQF